MRLGFLLFILAGNVAWASSPCDTDDLPCLRSRVAAHPGDLESRLALGQAQLDRAIMGQSGALGAALEQFEAVLRVKPQSASARVRRGFAWALMAGDEATIARQVERARRGFAEIDAAVALAPEDPAVRLVRAINAYQMPQSLERGSVAEQDFTWLLDRVKGGPPMPPALVREIFFHAGSFALKQRRPEAAQWLQRALELPGQRPSDAMVQSMLALAQEALTPHANAEKEKR